MSPSLRKLLGSLMLLFSLPIWAFAGTWVYMAALGEALWWVLIAYFCAAGLAWLFPAMWIIRWSSRA